MSTSVSQQQIDAVALATSQIAAQQQLAAQHAALAVTSSFNQPSGTLLSGLNGNNLTNFTYTTTGAYTPEYREEWEVSRITRRSKNGYFYIITVDAADEVFYRVWRGGVVPYLWAKAFGRCGRDIDGNKSTWNSVTKRSHLPATLGATYEKIEDTINEDIEDVDHAKYVAEMLKTKPENLKMIGQLEGLQEGSPDDDSKSDPNIGSSNATTPWVTSNIGSTSQPGGMISFTPPTPSIAMADEEVIKMDSDGEISFGPKMAEAIREAALNETQQGETTDGE